MLRNCSEVQPEEAGDGQGDHMMWEADPGPVQSLTLKASGSNPGFTEEPTTLQVQATPPHQTFPR